jgi:hypothetical protein
MQRILRIAAILVVLATVSGWIALGRNTGWTTTTTTTLRTDPVTGLTYPEYEDAFRPGLELLGAAFVLAGGLALAARLLGPKPASVAPPSHTVLPNQQPHSVRSR